GMDDGGEAVRRLGAGVAELTEAGAASPREGGWHLSRMGKAMSLLEVVELRKSYGEHVAVDGLSFHVDAGEVFGLLGPNGAGKSTTMMMLAGLRPADSGTVTIDGFSFDSGACDLKQILGIVPQDLAVYPDLTARENLQSFGKL